MGLCGGPGVRGRQSLLVLLLSLPSLLRQAGGCGAEMVGRSSKASLRSSAPLRFRSPPPLAPSEEHRFRLSVSRLPTSSFARIVVSLFCLPFSFSVHFGMRRSFTLPSSIFFLCFLALSAAFPFTRSGVYFLVRVTTLFSVRPFVCLRVCMYVRVRVRVSRD